jgi:hypothetical protein
MKRILRDGDTIQIGSHHLRYISPTRVSQLAGETIDRWRETAVLPRDLGKVDFEGA